MISISIVSFIFILCINLTYEQETGAYEIREHSLTRPYPAGRLCFCLQFIENLDYLFSFFYNKFILAFNW